MYAQYSATRQGQIRQLQKLIALLPGLVPCRRKGLLHMRTLSPSDKLVMVWIALVGFVDMTYTAFLMPLLIIFPTNNTMYSWASPVNLVLGGNASHTLTHSLLVNLVLGGEAAHMLLAIIW